MLHVHGRVRRPRCSLSRPTSLCSSRPHAPARPYPELTALNTHLHDLGCDHPCACCRERPGKQEAAEAGRYGRGGCRGGGGRASGSRGVVGVPLLLLRVRVQHKEGACSSGGGKGGVKDSQLSRVRVQAALAAASDGLTCARADDDAVRLPAECKGCVRRRRQAAEHAAATPTDTAACAQL
jgi:hypothetical protein